MRTFYWFTKDNKFFQKEFGSWTGSADLEIPNHSWVFDKAPGEEGIFCGYYVDGRWCYKSFHDFPNEFKLQLLLLGVR